MKDIDEKKVENTIEKLHKIFNKAQLTVPEIILAYGNLGYHLGAHIAGFENTGPDLETLKREYHLKPTIDVGLMIQGLIITSWEDDLQNNPEISDLAERYRKQEEEKDQK